MIQPICDICKHELIDFGAILISPVKDKKCTKYHICKHCFSLLIIKFNLDKL